MPTLFNTFTRTYVTVADADTTTTAPKRKVAAYIKPPQAANTDSLQFGTGGRPVNGTGQPPKTITNGNKN